VDQLAQQTADNIDRFFDPSADPKALSGNLEAIGIALQHSIREIGPIHDEATSHSRFSNARH
jgi:hypothetical protein